MRYQSEDCLRIIRKEWSYIMKNVKISGLQKMSMLDFPGRVACTVFTSGCNFRCPFCHNAGLVLSPGSEGEIDVEYFFDFLKKRKGLLDGVAITGGEPTLMPGLHDFIGRIKDSGYAVKLDTNGTSPLILEKLLKEKLVDYVAMDIKNSPEKYTLTAGITEKAADNLLAKVNESVNILMQGSVDFEFRTTTVKPYHTKEDFYKIGEWIAGDEKYFIQGFVDSGNIIGEGMSAFTPDELDIFLTEVKKLVPKAEIRGV